MPENNKFKEKKHREHIVKTEEKMTAEETPTASKREAKPTRRPSVYTIGIALYTYCAPLHKFRVLCEGEQRILQNSTVRCFGVAR